MGRKKPTPIFDDNPPVASSQGGGGGGGKKSKKKNRDIDDDEYMIPTEEAPQEEEVPGVPAPGGGGKKGKKKGGAKGKDDGDDKLSNVDHDEAEEAVAAPPVVFAGKKKQSKGKKNSKSSLFSGSSFDLLDEEKEGSEVENEKGEVEVEVEDEDEDEDEDVPLVKKSNGVFSASAIDAINDDDEVEEEKPIGDDNEDNDDVPVIEFTGKKKPSKKSTKKSGSLFAASAFDALEEEDENKDEEEDAPVISFTGKKKSSKSSKKSGNLFAAALLDEVVDDVDANSSVSASNDGELEDEDAPAITFSGKKKSSKSKKNKGASDLGEEVSGVTPELDQSLGKGSSSKDVVGNNGKDAKLSKQGSEEVVETLINKKKKKKSGRTAQEEDDLDLILAELGGGAPSVKAAAPPPQKDNAQVQDEAPNSSEVIDEKKEAENETGESAAAKKKRKKKEKEKEKKAAAAATTTSAAVEVKKEEKQDMKKLPKHVREMQELMARRKEAEERLKREEEERLRKEEEERIRQEELERQAEEARRKKKEREKEKLLKKKLEGKLLTGKQKEEARRLEAMRNQILAKSGALPLTETGATTTKRPKYQTKKGKAAATQANGAASGKSEESIDEKQNQQDVIAEVNKMEIEKVEETGAMAGVAEQKPEVAQVAEENEVEEDEDWDAKSWDDTTLNLVLKSAFDEEDVEEEAEPVTLPVAKKETRYVMSPPPEKAGASSEEAKTSLAPRKVANPDLVKGEDVESKENHEEIDATDKNRRKDAATKREARSAEAHAKRSADNLRSPICCIMGHVDTGKTKLLDCIRRTNVQEGEAGGITQQIGATYFPAENIRDRTRELKADATLKVPGLLVIDTPGHESFTNLRSRGSGLCDIAILVVDIMHGLEPQTIESLNLLKMRNTEFIVALNKVDRLYGWKTCPNAPIVKAMKQQNKDVQMEFRQRLEQIVTQFKEQGMNTELYYKNKEMGETFSIVPTSAINGEGIPDLLLLLVQWTQKTMVEKLMFSNEMQCTVLEVKVIEGLGTTIDVVLVNGVLHEGDQIVVCGMQGPIATTIRALLTPHPMKELRVKGSYLHHKEIKAAQGIKITAQGLEHAIAGTALYVVGPDDDVEDAKESAMQDMNSVMSRIDKSGEGVCVQASTLGSLEALLEFLKTPAVNIPVSGISIGPVHKKDVMKASVMLERKKEYATILAFDVKVTPEARELADESGVKIFIADIIYHLFDQFKAYIDNLKEEKKKEAAEEAVFPCVLKIMPNCVFNKKDPIVLGVDVLEGIAKVGTPLCIPSREYITIGRIASIENNHKQVDVARKGQKVAIKITSNNHEEQQKMYGRHFEIDDELVSHITRSSIDVLKANYREDLSIEDWKLVVKLKNLFKIQ